MSLDCFLTMGSPWAYLGHGALMEMASRLGIAVCYRPTPMKRLFSLTGGVLLPQRHPARQDYRSVDLQRWCQFRRLPLVRNAAHSRFDPELADRVVVTLVEQGQNPDPFMRLAFSAVWVGEQDLGDASVLADLLGRAGHEAELCLQQAGEPAAVKAYEDNLSIALAAGVFGAPSYVWSGEIFWGQDRIELLATAIESRRAPYCA